MINFIKNVKGDLCNHRQCRKYELDNSYLLHRLRIPHQP